MKLLDRVWQVLFLVAFLVIVTSGVVAAYPRYRQARGLVHERDQIRRRIEAKQREIAGLRDRQRRFTTDREFVESLARENRRVFPNELVFVFEN